MITRRMFGALAAAFAAVGPRKVEAPDDFSTADMRVRCYERYAGVYVVRGRDAFGRPFSETIVA